ncbi:hypothetical protein Anas_01078 [Armadillidium nasatum]|uniref:C2H2-type domain-containing protein n=1 Tax=Armadillidium nasatum TaxID=96803 RepID=A0A5N5SRG0_9CRUS|nr:hypothetical protein Anas_01078 [Armadillidium nasatum]
MFYFWVIIYLINTQNATSVLIKQIFVYGISLIHCNDKICQFKFIKHIKTHEASDQNQLNHADVKL